MSGPADPTAQLEQEALATPGTSSPDEDRVERRAVPGAPDVCDYLSLAVWRDPDSVKEMENPSSLAIDTFIAYAIKTYGIYRSRTLWGLLNEDMEDWDDSKWSAISPGVTKRFRQFLIHHGVFVEARKGLSITDGVRAAICASSYHVWTQEDINRYLSRDAELLRRLQNDPTFLADITNDGDFPRPPSPDASGPTPTHAPAAASPVAPQPRPPPRALTPAEQDARDRNVPIVRHGGPTSTKESPVDAGGPPPPSPPLLTPQPLPRSYYPIPYRPAGGGDEGRYHPPPRPSVSPPDRPIDLGKRLGELNKQYTDDMRYKAALFDVFDIKFRIFEDVCYKTGIPEDLWHHAFSTMLAGRAKDFYYQRILRQGIRDPPPLAEMISLVKQHFENSAQQQQYLTMWRDISFPKILEAHPDRTALENLEDLFNKLQTLQRAVHTLDQSDTALMNQLINAVREYPPCHTALQLPASTYDGLCQQLRIAMNLHTGQRAAAQYIARPPPEPGDPHSYWTDRKYRGQGRNARFGRRRGAAGRGTGRQASDRSCFICGKQGCWSTNHPEEDRRKAYDRFKAGSKGRDKSRAAYQAFLTWWEGVADIESDPESDNPIAQYHSAMGTLYDSGEDSEGDDEPLDYPLPATAFQMTAFLQHSATRHQLTKEDPYRGSPDAAKGMATASAAKGHQLFVLNRYDDLEFHGIMPDTGAAEVSTGGQLQFRALQREFPTVQLNKAAAGEAKIHFGPGNSVSSLGRATVPTPFGAVDFHILPQNTPFLLSLADMDRLGLIFNNLQNVMTQGSFSLPLTRKWGHAWLPVKNEKIIANGFLTETELRRLHRRFGHPSVNRLHKVLTAAGHETDREILAAITRICHNCQMNEKRPLRFKFTLKDDVEFNAEVVSDIMFLDGNSPALHVVDTATAFNAARFLPGQTARQVWETLKLCWIDVYQGPPDTLVVDAGKAFTAEEFKTNAKSMAITVKEVPVEAHHRVGKVERYHTPLRRAYNIIRSEDPSLSRDGALQAAVKAVNDTAGPNGLVPTLLVFGAYPRMVDDSSPAPTQRQRAKAIKKAMEEVRRAQAERRVADALSTRNGPDTGAIQDLPLQSLVRVWRENKGWTGPFRLIGVDGETATVQGAHTQHRFPTTAVKAYNEDPSDPVALSNLPDDDAAAAPASNDAAAPDPADDAVQDSITVAVPALPAVPVARRGRPRRDALVQAEFFLVETGSRLTAAAWMTAKEEADAALAIQLRAEGKITTPGAPFEESTKAEIKALTARGVFKFIPYNRRAHGGIRVFKSRIVNEVKGKATPQPYEKSRLVIQGYGDEDKREILTQSPTIQRVSQRLILALAPSFFRHGDFVLWLRDITQAYTQSTSDLERTILAKLPAQIRDQYPEDTVMLVIKPLYGIAEAGTHWWVTYYNHHRKKLEMVTSTYDPCLLISSPTNAEFGIVGMQTDDTLGLSTLAFSRNEDTQLEAAKLTAKPKEQLEDGGSLQFNGGIVKRNGDTITLTQKGQGARLNLVDPMARDAKQQYVEQRARGAYLASICQPEACFDLSSAAQHQDPTSEDIAALNRRIQWQIDHQDRGLTFLPMDLTAARLYVFVDGSFANNRDLTSQLGFALILGTEKPLEEGQFKITGNLLHFSSTKCKRVTRSVLASEIYGMVAGVDIALALTSTLEAIVRHVGLPSIPTIVCTDSYSLYECLVKLGTTKEKRLMIDILALRESYEKRELQEIRWIDGKDNLADALTKASPNKVLESFISTNEVTVRVEGWVSR